MNHVIGIAVASSVMAMSTPCLAQTLTLYRVDSAHAVDLGTLGGDEAEASDINNSGGIVGWARDSEGTKRAFHYIGATMKNIGPSIRAIPSNATGLNDYGEVVGNYEDFHKVYGFYWHKNVGLVRLSDNLHPDEGFSDAYLAFPLAISSQGQIVGSVEGYVFDPTPAVPDPLPWLPCYVVVPAQWLHAYANPQPLFCPYETWPGNVAYDVNDSGAMAVSEQRSYYRGYVWKDGFRTLVPLPEIGNPREIQVFGINESGGVVGVATLSDPDRKHAAAYWDGTSVHSKVLGVLPGGDGSVAYEINDTNFIAGYSTTLIDGGYLFADAIKSRAFLWHVKFGLYELPVPPGFISLTTDCVAKSLNNREEHTGLIELVGYCTKYGKKRAVRWNVVVTKQTIQIGM